MKNHILKLTFLFFALQSCTSQTYYINDINLYKNTPIWDLAKAVDKEDENAINNYLKENPKAVLFPKGYDILFQDEPSLLIWTLANSKYKSFSILLEKGSDPNFLTESKTSPLMFAVDFEPHGQLTNINHIKALIEKGANPNYVRQGYINNERNTIRGESPLTIACNTGDLEAVKLLIESGANYDTIIYTPQGGDKHFYQTSSLKASFMFNRAKVLKYLIIDKNIEIPSSFGIRENGDNLDINYYLRKLIFKVDSPEYLIKMEIIEHLEPKINYRSSTIPKMAIKFAKINYGSNWQEFLDKY